MNSKSDDVKKPGFKNSCTAEYDLKFKKTVFAKISSFIERLLIFLFNFTGTEQGLL